MNSHDELRQEIEALRACISWLGAANRRISESPALETVLREALECARAVRVPLQLLVLGGRRDGPSPGAESRKFQRYLLKYCK